MTHAAQPVWGGVDARGAARLGGGMTHAAQPVWVGVDARAAARLGGG